jgi:membrane protease YdiL (CAAX protease family)
MSDSGVPPRLTVGRTQRNRSPVGSRAANWAKLRDRRLWAEIAIVLGLSLGASAVYSIVSLIAKLTAETALGSQSTSLNASQSSREWLDFTYQFLAIFFALVPVVLVVYLLAISGGRVTRRLGLDFQEPLRDLGRGVMLVLVIGVPGIALYFAGRALGITVNVVPAPLDGYWWTVPILILSALRAAVTEEVIVVGYLYARLRQLGWARGRWGMWPIIVATAVLRGSYHLYQGIGPFFGNVVMGIVFGWLYVKWGRVMPLVIAHWIIDIASFVGYAWAVTTFPGLFQLPAN